MSDEIVKYNLYGHTIRRLLVFAGLWPAGKPSIVHRLVPFVHSLAALLVNCAIFNFCHRNFGSLSLLLTAFGITLSFFTMIQKATCLSFYRKRLAELHATLNDNFGEDLLDNELRPILLSPLLSFYRPSLILSSFTFVANVTYMITPFVLIVVQLLRGARDVKYALPLPTFYPWRTDENIRLYVAHYALEAYALMCMATLTSAIDSLFGFYIFQICGQLRTISHRIRNVKSSDNYQKVMSECIARHQVLTRCQHQLEQIYGPVVLWMFVTTAMVLCGLMYQACHISPGKIPHILLYMITKSLQMLLYGWFGTFLMTENEMFREAIYASAWPGSGEKCFMTNVLIMMTYKPFALKACGLSTISIDLFATMANTALSYFFMIRTVEASSNV